MTCRSAVFPIASDPHFDKLLVWALRQKSSSHLLEGVRERILATLPIFCTVCGQMSRIKVEHENFRETCVCAECGSINRQRQIAWVVCSGFGGTNRPRSLTELSQRGVLTVCNTESYRAIHEALKGLPGYQCSEYLGPDVPRGACVNGITNQDLQCLTYGDDVFDLVLSSEILEHVPDPYQAHREIHRVLKPGGRHVFTVPFYATEYVDEVRARLGTDGRPVMLKEPLYHGDPLRPEGVLVYTIFGLEMLVKLYEIGFRTRVYHLYKPWLGIVGPNAIVFEAVKAAY